MSITKGKARRGRTVANAAASAPHGAPKYMRVSELSKRWSVSTPTIYRWIDQKKMARVVIEGVLLIPIIEVERIEAKSLVGGDETSL